MSSREGRNRQKRTPEAKISRETKYPTAGAMGWILDPVQARFYDTLPSWPTVAMRKQFQMQRPIPRDAMRNWDEIAPDPRGWITSMRVDVDRSHALRRWEDLGFPEPTFTVWDPATGRAHLIWMLEIWVNKKNFKSLRLFQRIQRAYTEALEGDRSYPGTFHHNPLGGRYSCRVGAKADYQLSELQNHVQTFMVDETTRVGYRTRFGSTTIREDFMALGRNCSTFERVRGQAYKAVRIFRATDAFEAFSAHVDDLVEDDNRRHDAPLPNADLSSIAKSITSWAWHVYLQGRAAAAERRNRYQKTRDEFLESVGFRRRRTHELRALGKTAKQIASELCISIRTVWTYLKTPLDIIVQSVQGPPSISSCMGVGVAANSDPDGGEGSDIEIFPERGSRVPVMVNDESPIPQTPSPPPNVIPEFLGSHGIMISDRDEYEPTEIAISESPGLLQRVVRKIRKGCATLLALCRALV